MKEHLKFKIIIFSLLLIACVTLAQASFASDIYSDTDSQSIAVNEDLSDVTTEDDDNNMKLNDLSSQGEKTASNNDLKLGDEEGEESKWYVNDNEFTSLEEAINNASSGSTIYGSAGNYTVTSKIKIEKKLTITSKNSTPVIFNGNNSAGIFEVDAFYGELTLKNLVFTNCFGNDGGVLTNKKILTVRNCTFIDNNAKGISGAIYNTGRLTIDKCIFTGNSGTETEDLPFNYAYENDTLNGYIEYANGGAICSEGGTLTITDSQFIDNYVRGNGGVLGLYNTKATVNRSLFNNNRCGNIGGAIFIANDATLTIENSILSNGTSMYGSGINNLEGSLNIKNCTFEGNKIRGTYSGGAIYTDGDANISDSRFINNKGAYAGAIRNGANLTLINCSFEDNYANYTGGAISNNGHIIAIANNFTNNRAGTDGGAICSFTEEGEISSVKVYNSTFDSNQALDTGGSVYNSKANFEAYHTTFKNEESSIGGSILSFDGMLSIEYSKFIDCVADLSSDKFGELEKTGGAIALVKSTALTPNSIKNCEFINCSSNMAGAIYATSRISLIANNFTDIKSNDETLMLINVEEIRDNAYTNCSILFEISTNKTDLDLGQIGHLDIALSNPTYYDSDILDAATYDIYANGKILNTSESSYASFLPNERGSNLVYVIASISYKASNIIEFELEKFDDFLNLSYTINGENIIIVANITDENGDEVKTGNVSFKIVNASGSIIKETLVQYSEGEGFIYDENFEIGLYNLTTIYRDAQYKNQINQTRFLIGKLSSRTVADYIVEKNRFIVNVFVGPEGIDGTSGNVTFLFNGIPIVTSDLDNSRVSFSYNGLDYGDYEVSVQYNGNDMYGTSFDNITVHFYDIEEDDNNTSNITNDAEWDLAKLSISAPDVKTTYSLSSYYVVSVKYEGKALKNQNVSILIAGKEYKLRTDSAGQAKLALTKFASGTYTATVMAGLGDIKKMAKSKITVLKMKIKFKNVSKTVKKGKYFKLTVLDSKNKAVKGQKVQIKIKGKTYKVKTNSNGLAKLKLKIKKGKYKITYSLVSNKNYEHKKTKASRKITIK